MGLGRWKWGGCDVGNRVRYKKDRTRYVYDFDSLTTVPRAASESTVGPLPSCQDCEYSGHGFVCWQGEDSCLKIKMGQIRARERRKAKCISMR